MKTRASNRNSGSSTFNSSLQTIVETKPRESDTSAMEIEEDKSDSFRQTYSSPKILQPNQNLQMGIYLKKAEKFKFERVQGKRLENNDRQWILRLYYWMKCQPLFSQLCDTKICQSIADIACCSKSVIQTIIKEDEVVSRDKRGHPMP